MSENLVTLAIRTSQRAQMIKSVLEDNGIETVIHNLNPEKPELTVGVRVRIKENDLPRALKIVEEMEQSYHEESQELTTRVLIPIDFNDIIHKTVDIGFNFADILSAEVVFLYVYFSPAFTITMNNDINTYSISDSELLRRIVSNANTDMDNLTHLIKSKIESGELPNIPFRFELKEGVPEEEILDYCKKHQPALVVMGTHGRKVSDELMGSVAAEVMESCLSPVFAIPSQMAIKNTNEIAKIAFLTSFDQKDLIAIDRTINLLGSQKKEIYFIHTSEKNEAWDEVMLAGIKAYFSNHYPHLTTHYALLGATDSTEILDDYLKEKNIDLLAFNTRRRRLLARLFNPGLIYKLIQRAETPLFATHIR